MMRLFSVPTALLGLLAIAHIPSALAKPYPVHVEELHQLTNTSQIEKRACLQPNKECGWYKQLCCAADQQCGEDPVNGQAICTGGQSGGGWKLYTSTWVESVGLVTYTTVYSSYVGGAATPTGTCKGTESPCGNTCCPGGTFCDTNKQCKLFGAGSSGGILPTLPGTLAPSAPLRPTSSGLVIVTYTGPPTATVPFQTPIPTGANGVPIPVEEGGGGLSGGAIAGIVIGVILGILFLLLLCLFCCARALFDTILAIFGLGKKRKHTHEDTYIEEHHHHSGGAAAAGGGRWYGQGRPSRPSRVGSEKKSGLGKGAGVAAALGGLALMLGMKRRHDQKHDDKSTTVSGSSYYYSDYTSSSSASSDRRTRNTRHSSRR